MTEEEWKQLEPMLVEAEHQGHDEYFQEQQAGDKEREGPGALLLRHLMRRGDAEAVILFRAVEMYQHELTRKGYAAAFRLGQRASSRKGKAEVK